MEKTYYYTDELNDDFAGTNIQAKALPEDYEYIPKSGLRKAAAWILHHIIATPICYLFLKIASAQKIVGREKLKAYRKSGYYLYGNHTRAAGDAFTPTMVAFPKKPYLVTSIDAVSIPFLKRIVEDLGAMPIPDSLRMHRKFNAAIEEHASKGHVVCIYPEAHIWPYYTKIRPFAATSFAYPVKTGKPSFTFTTTYQKRKFFGGVKTIVYVDGPFFPDETLPKSEQKAKLREEVYQAMAARSERSTYAKYRYVKRG